MSFAAIDWVMSLSPHWASTIYGFLFIAGQLISSMALMIAIVVLLARTGPLSGILQPRHTHDLGKLLLAFLMLWAYFRFFPASYHLVWQPAGRNHLLLFALAQPMGRSSGHRGHLPLFRSVLPAAFARP